MPLDWIPESPPQWDVHKQQIIGAAPGGVFGLGPQAIGGLLPGDWWRVEENGEVLGYGWMDCTWGDAEVLLAVHPDHRRRGVGTFILDHLEGEAAGRGVNYLYNEVRPSHPDGSAVTRWLADRRFAQSGDDRLLRRAVRRPSGA